MPLLARAAREDLALSEITPREWARRHGWEDGWHGDTCGCPDDQCIGFHHDAHEECPCFGALLREAVALP